MNTPANGVMSPAIPGNAKLEELRAKKSQREAASKVAIEAREIEELELEEKLIDKMNGKRGVAFEIVNTDIGVFAVRPPDYIVAKQFNALDKKGDEDVAKFVRPCVIHPSADGFVLTLEKNGGIAWRLANAALALYGAEAEKRVGKF